MHQIWRFYLWSFQRYKGVPKFRNCSRDQFRGKIFILRQRASCSVLAHKIWSAKVMEGSQILNLGHVTLTTPTLGVICHPVANTCYDEYAHQIWSLYVKPFHRYWAVLKISIFTDKIYIAHARYHVIHKLVGFRIPMFPIQYATFTELSLTIRDVSYSLPCKMIALFGPLKNVFWG